MPVSMNNHLTATTANIRADSAEQPLPADLCACGHPYSRHDPISIRYCDATVTAGLNRGCVCRTGTEAYPGRM